MLKIDVSTFNIDVKSGRSEPLRAIDQGRFNTLTRATKAKIFNILEAGINSLLINSALKNFH